MAEDTPRRLLLKAFEANLACAQTGDGYRTDIGRVVTLEPGQLDPAEVDDGVAVYIERQVRATDPALLRTHRLTTVAVLVKRKALLAAEAALDDMVDDIERVLLNRQQSWPKGFSAPAYLEMEPLRAPASADWIGALLRYTSHIPIR